MRFATSFLSLLAIMGFAAAVPNPASETLGVRAGGRPDEHDPTDHHWDATHHKCDSMYVLDDEKWRCWHQSCFDHHSQEHHRCPADHVDHDPHWHHQMCTDNYILKNMKCYPPKCEHVHHDPDCKGFNHSTSEEPSTVEARDDDFHFHDDRHWNPNRHERHGGHCDRFYNNLNGWCWPESCEHNDRHGECRDYPHHSEHHNAEEPTTVEVRDVDTADAGGHGGGGHGGGGHGGGGGGGGHGGGGGGGGHGGWHPNCGRFEREYYGRCYPEYCFDGHYNHNSDWRCPRW